MGEVLDDDAGADAARADGGDERGEGGDLADVGELVEETVQFASEPLAGAGVGLPDGGLEEALVEDGGEEVERGVGVGQHEEHGAFAVRELVDADGVVGEDLAHLADAQGAGPDSEGDDDAFLRLAGALAVSPVAAQGESYALEHAPGVVVAFAPSARRGLVVHGLCGFHHDVHGALVRLVMLAGVHELEQVGQVVEARLVPADARLVVPAVGVPPGEVHPGDQCREQRAFGGAPEAIVLGILGGGVDDDVLGQLADGFCFRRAWRRGSRNTLFSVS